MAIRSCKSLAVTLLIVIALMFSPAPLASWSQDPPKVAIPKDLQPRLRYATFFSKSLQREMRYRVLLPANYETSEKRYPALFLLHGLYGDFTNWTTLTHLSELARNLDLIIAMPDAGNSWYVNSATVGADRFEDYIVRDFIFEIDSHFRTLHERSARAIAGLSMGAYAAVDFSMKHPELFSYSGAISAALDAPQGLDERIPEFAPSLQKAFGPHGSQVRQANDVFLLLKNGAAESLPYFYVDCGEADMFLIVNRTFTSQLEERKIGHEYHEFPGAHTWQYWDAAIRRFLLLLTTKQFVNSNR
jgi:putative tributyrin esterase